MVFLRSIDLRSPVTHRRGFPFDLPIVRKFERIEIERPVTILVGENGSGKSTLLEGIATAANSITIGGEDSDRDSTLSRVREFGSFLRLGWHRKTHRGFFLRAEDFFRFTRRLVSMCEELSVDAEECEKTMSGEGLKTARSVILGQRSAIVRKYGEDLDWNSHGESFLKLFRERLVPKGLYLLDEPEAPLSPQRQLAFLSMLKEATEKEDCQFIIATHSPILISFPHAGILSFDACPPKWVEYDEVEQVRLVREFLNRPEAFLRHL